MVRYDIRYHHSKRQERGTVPSSLMEREYGMVVANRRNDARMIIISSIVVLRCYITYVITYLYYQS